MKDLQNKIYKVLMGLFMALGLLLIVCISSCDLEQESKDAQIRFDKESASRIQESADSIKRRIVYIKDERTGICFAVIEGHHQNEYMFTVVPEEKVKDILVK